MPLAQIGDKGLFTKELDIALLNGEIDLAVHSLKDLPTRLPEGLELLAIGEREDPRDAVLLHPRHRGPGNDLHSRARVGTSSLRRAAQLRRAYPRLEVVPVRGNLNTRLRKLEQGDEYDALVLALAGVRRLGWEARVDQLLDTEELCLHAVGQGALAVTGRAGAGTPPRLRELLARAVHHPATAACCLAERALLRELGGGCSVPLGVASACLEQERIRLRARLLDPEGREALQAELESHPGESSEELARRLAEELRQRGADRLLAAATSTATATAPAAQNQQPQSHSSAHPSSV